MKIEDGVIETLNCPVSIALSKKQKIRWKTIREELSKLPGKPSIVECARKSLDQMMDEAEVMLKDYKSKNLDFTGIK